MERDRPLSHVLQGYLAHKKRSPPRTVQSDYLGPYVVLGKGAIKKLICNAYCVARTVLQKCLAHEKTHPPSTLP